MGFAVPVSTADGLRRTVDGLHRTREYCAGWGDDVHLGSEMLNQAAHTCHDCCNAVAIVAAYTCPRCCNAHLALQRTPGSCNTHTWLLQHTHLTNTHTWQLQHAHLAVVTHTPGCCNAHLAHLANNVRLLDVHRAANSKALRCGFGSHPRGRAQCITARCNAELPVATQHCVL